MALEARIAYETLRSWTNECEHTRQRSSCGLWILKTPSGLKMQVFAPFVRSIRKQVLARVNIVTSMRRS
jgi:hypothetical protein